jgi:hypothetical protein
VWRRVWLAEAAALNIKSMGRVMHYERMRALAGGVHTCAISTDYLHELLRTCATFRANRYASRVKKLLHKSNDQLARLLIMAKIVCEIHAGLCARCRLPPPPPRPCAYLLCSRLTGYLAAPPTWWRWVDGCMRALFT